MHNDVIESDIHSTDTHGYSEMIFGVTHLLGISFAPRIKDIKDQKLYSFESKSKLKELGYQVSPNGRINSRIISNDWDDILRFVTTIKLKETPASQLFRRLNSYSRQHPLYQALKEFGKIPKTLFLLRCIDDVGRVDELFKNRILMIILEPLWRKGKSDKVYHFYLTYDPEAKLYTIIRRYGRRDGILKQIEKSYNSQSRAMARDSRS